MNVMISTLRRIPGPRIKHAMCYSLLVMLRIALVVSICWSRSAGLDLLVSICWSRSAGLDLLASLCGCESYVGPDDFAGTREAVFHEILQPGHALPSHDMFSRLFRLFDPDALSRCLALSCTMSMRTARA